MSTTDELSMHLTGFGPFRVTAIQMDAAIQRHLPGSPYTLRQKIDAHPNNVRPPGSFDRLITVTEYLMVLAALDNRPVD